MTRWARTLLAAAFVVGLFQSHAYPMGLRVSPGAALIQGLPPGQRVELSTPITIMNDDDRPHVMTIAALSPAEQNMALPSGYTALPDPSWVSFTKSEVVVAARKHGTVKMVVNIPPGEAYCDQHWSVALAVRSKPGRGQLLALGLYPRFEMETVPSSVAPPSTNKAVRPRGRLVVTPSLTSVTDVAPGSEPKRVTLTIWNNTSDLWRGEANLVTDAQAAKKERLSLSGGHRWLPDPSWIEIKQPALVVQPAEPTKLVLEVRVPEGEQNHTHAWEAILLLRCDRGPEAIARLRVKSLQATHN